MTSGDTKRKIVEIISIDINVFNALARRMEDVEEKVGTLYRKQVDLGLKTWLDNQDLCLILGITKRTLQSYRGSVN